MSLTQIQLEQAFHAQRARLYRFLVRITRSPGTAEDLLQDTFVTLWARREQYEERGEMAAYLRRIAYRLFLNRRQSERRRSRRELVVGSAQPRATSDTSPVERRDADALVRTRLDEVLSHLSETQREAFLLFRICGLSCAEIGRLLDVPPKTVETRVLRASRRLAGLLASTRREVVPE